MPIQSNSTGAVTMAKANDTPMLAPIIAIALTRLCSAVRSATNALSAEEIAPAPCRARKSAIRRQSRAYAQGGLTLCHKEYKKWPASIHRYRAQARPERDCLRPEYAAHKSRRRAQSRTGPACAARK